MIQLGMDEGKNRSLKLKCLHCLNSYWVGISKMKNYLARNYKDVAHFTQCSKEVNKFFKNLLSDRETKIDVHVDDNNDIQVVGTRRDKLQHLIIPLMTC